jgi:GTP cyclohydrolase I
MTTLGSSLRNGKVPFAANDNVEKVNANLTVMEEGIAAKVRDILDILVIDQDNDPNTKDTPRRVAKMMVHEIYGGRYTKEPKVTTFPNTKGLDELITTVPITVRSNCSHHLCPIIGKCWIGIVPGELLAGLSKYNRIVDWFARRPQIQEELTIQIADHIEKTLKPKGLAVVMIAQHTCMTHRGVLEHGEAAMSTSVMRGVFRKDTAARAEFMHFVPKP